MSIGLLSSEVLDVCNQMWYAGTTIPDRVQTKWVCSICKSQKVHYIGSCGGIMPCKLTNLFTSWKKCVLCVRDKKYTTVARGGDHALRGNKSSFFVILCRCGILISNKDLAWLWRQSQAIEGKHRASYYTAWEQQTDRQIDRLVYACTLVNEGKHRTILLHSMREADRQTGACTFVNEGKHRTSYYTAWERQTDRCMHICQWR